MSVPFVQRVAGLGRRFLDGTRWALDRALPMKSRPLAWILPTALLLVAIVSVPLLVTGDQGLPRYRALRAERDEVQRQNETLRHEVQTLAREVEALQADPQSMERIARDDLGMVRPGEILFQFPE